MSFDPITSPIDHILLMNQKSPGLAVVSNVSSFRRWDERKGYALSGGRLRYRGIGIARPHVTIRLFTAEDFAAWDTFRILVQREPVGQRANRAMDIWHPILEDAEISKVVVEDVVQPKQTADGEWTLVIKFIEYRPPVPRFGTIESSAERPPDQQDQAIENLQAIIENNGVGNITDALAPIFSSASSIIP